MQSTTNADRRYFRSNRCSSIVLLQKHRQTYSCSKERNTCVFWIIKAASNKAAKQSTVLRTKYTFLFPFLLHVTWAEKKRTNNNNNTNVWTAVVNVWAVCCCCCCFGYTSIHTSSERTENARSKARQWRRETKQNKRWRKKKYIYMCCWLYFCC